MEEVQQGVEVNAPGAKKQTNAKSREKSAKEVCNNNTLSKNIEPTKNNIDILFWFETGNETGDRK